MAEEKQKDCFGMQWEEDDPICAGGLDPLYLGPGGTRIRPKCGSYDACGRTFRANDAQHRLQQQAARVIPPENLVRQQIPQHAAAPPAVAHQPPARVQPSYPQHYQPPQPPAPPQQVQPTYARPSYAQPPTAPYQPPSPPPNAYPAVYHHTAVLQPYEAPPFLTVSEDASVPLWQRVLAESARAGLKGIMQQGAHLLDHTQVVKSRK